jgi:hypothetical protein
MCVTKTRQANFKYIASVLLENSRGIYNLWPVNMSSSIIFPNLLGLYGRKTLLI